MPKGDPTWPAMPIDECLAFADEWSRGMTIYPGSQGWRVVTMLLAEEVRSLRDDVEVARTVANGNVDAKFAAWNELNALAQENDRLREKVAQLERGEYICKKCGLRKDDEHPKGDF